MGRKKKAKGGGVKTQPREDKCAECANSLTDCDSWAQCESVINGFTRNVKIYQMRYMLLYKKMKECIGIANRATEECPNY